MSSTPQKPGWVNVPGKGRRYWTGSEYRFYGPSDSAASKGQMSVSGDIAGMWNNFVGQYGRSTSNPQKTGQQSYTQQQVKDAKGKGGGWGAYFGISGKEAPKPESNDQKPPAPAPADEKPTTTTTTTKPQVADYTVGDVTYDGNTGRPKNAPEGGYSLEPDGSMTPHSSEKSEKGDVRVNANGLVSYGKDLSSLNKFTSAFTGGYELTDIKSAFQSNDLLTAYQNGSNKISTEETPYELPDGATPSNVGGKYSMSGVDTSIQSTGYQISDKSVPGTVGGNPSDPQDGTSDKPDTADKVRQIRMRRKGPRDDGGPRGFAIDQANEMAQNSVSETKGNGMNAKRRAIRSTFLDHEGNSVQAITAARAVAGVGNDSNGDDVYNVGGELVYAKPGEERKAINALMSGNNPMAHLDVPTTPDTQPDTPAASELSPAFAQETPGAQEFFKTELKKIKDKNK